MADQVRALEAERGEKLVVGEREVEEIVERLDAGRARHSRMRGRVHAERAGEAIEERRPRAPLVVGMEIHQRRTAAAGEELERHGAASDLDPALVRHQAEPFRAPDGHQRSL